MIYPKNYEQQWYWRFLTNENSYMFGFSNISHSALNNNKTRSEISWYELFFTLDVVYLLWHHQLEILSNVSKFMQAVYFFYCIFLFHIILSVKYWCRSNSSDFPRIPQISVTDQSTVWKIQWQSESDFFLFVQFISW